MKNPWTCFTCAESFGRSLPRPCSLAIDAVRDKSYRWSGKEREKAAGLQVFQYTLEGRGCIAVGGIEHQVPAGSGFLCRIYDPEILYYYPADAHEPWRFIYLVFRNAQDWVDSLNHEAGHVFALPEDCQYLRQARAFWDQAETSIQLEDFEGLEFISQLFSDICRAQALGKKVSRARQLAEKAVARMRERVESADSAATIAEYLGVSVEHLCRVFRHELHVSPLAYFQKQKLRHACALLRGSKASAKEIAGRIGCGNAANFSRLFKQHLGLSPSQFRARSGLVLPSLEE